MPRVPHALASAFVLPVILLFAFAPVVAGAAGGALPLVTMSAQFGVTPAPPSPPRMGSALALATRAPRARADAEMTPSTVPVLGGARARILLQSLTLPGWGQASLGRSTSATVFATIEAGIWTSFVAFKVQQAMRTDTYVHTAKLYAGIDLTGRDESFRRIVGQFPNSDDYNLYVVYRDAANLYYGDPAAMNAYIEAHSLRGSDTWVWPSPESYALYQDERKRAQRAGLRANTALGLAVANRIVSALHAARYAGTPTGHATRIEVGPAGDDLSGGRLALTTHF